MLHISVMMNTESVMNKYGAEFIGTFVLFTIILKSKTAGPYQKYIISLGLLLAILLVGDISDAHLNPAFSMAKYVRGDLPSRDLLGYATAQILGGMAAAYL